MKYVSRCLCLFLLLPALSARAETAFTYQGYLEFQNAPADSTYDFQFRLFNSPEEGDEIGTVQSAPGVAVTGGVFTVLLDFGEAPFADSPRWLEIAVKPVRTAVYTVLRPRQRVGASPFAVRTLGVAPGAVDTLELADDAVTRAKIAPDAIGTMEIQDGTVASVDIRDGAVTSTDIANGTLLPEDVQGGLYSEKTNLYEVRSTTTTVAAFAGVRSASCSDANDLAIWAGCDAAESGTGLSFNTLFSNWDSEAGSAEITCTGNNLDPTSPADFTAVIWCVSVD